MKTWIKLLPIWLDVLLIKRPWIHPRKVSHQERKIIQNSYVFVSKNRDCFVGLKVGFCWSLWTIKSPKLSSRITENEREVMKLQTLKFQHFKKEEEHEEK